MILYWTQQRTSSHGFLNSSTACSRVSREKLTSLNYINPQHNISTKHSAYKVGIQSTTVDIPKTG